MITYSQHELDAKMALFMKKKMHQFPELRNERYFIEPADSIKPVEKRYSTKVSHIFENIVPSRNLHSAA